MRARAISVKNVGLTRRTLTGKAVDVKCPKCGYDIFSIVEGEKHATCNRCGEKMKAKEADNAKD